MVGHHWDKAARLLGIPPDQHRARLVQLADGFTDAFSDALDAIEAPEAQDVRSRTIDRLAAHTAAACKGCGTRSDDELSRPWFATAPWSG